MKLCRVTIVQSTSRVETCAAGCGGPRSFMSFALNCIIINTIIVLLVLLVVVVVVLVTTSHYYLLLGSGTELSLSAARGRSCRSRLIVLLLIRLLLLLLLLLVVVVVVPEVVHVVLAAPVQPPGRPPRPGFDNGYYYQ